MLHSICQQVWKIQQWPQNWKMLVFNPIPKKGNAKECSSYCTIVLISQASKVMLKILQIRFQQEVNQETPDVQVGSKWGLEKAEEPEIKLPVFIGSWQIEGEKMEAMTNFIFLGSKIMALNLQASQLSFQSRTGMCTSHGMVAGPGTHTRSSPLQDYLWFTLSLKN